MLLAVEGGGFFSSSASGYSKGLNLLLLGQTDKEQPMRVTPWNHYHAVDQEADPNLQLASGKNRIVCGCASFVCFGGAAAGSESPSPQKVGPTDKQEVLAGSPDFDKSKDQAHLIDPVDDDGSNKKILHRKSSLKKSVNSAPVASAVVNGGNGSGKRPKTSCEMDNDDTSQMERRKVQWTDNNGGELFEVWEFEMSEVESDSEFDHGNGRTCLCRIM